MTTINKKAGVRFSDWRRFMTPFNSTHAWGWFHKAGAEMQLSFTEVQPAFIRANGKVIHIEKDSKLFAPQKGRAMSIWAGNPKISETIIYLGDIETPPSFKQNKKAYLIPMFVGAIIGHLSGRLILFIFF